MKNFKLFTLVVYMLLILAVFLILMLVLGAIPALALTATLCIFDSAINSNPTLIYGLVSLVTAPLFNLFTRIYDQLSANSHKQPISKEINNDNFKEVSSSANTLAVELSPKLNPVLSSSSPLFSSKENLQDESQDLNATKNVDRPFSKR